MYARPTALLAIARGETPLREVPEPTSARVARAYREHRGLVFRLALRYGSGNRAWAEDITQEVFISLLKSIDRLDHARGLEPWLYRVTTNRCLNRLKVDRFRRSAPVRWVLSQQTEAPDLEARVEMRDELRVVAGALAELPPKQRVALCMHHLDGLSMSEVGEVLGHTKGYVCKLIAKAEAALNQLEGRATP